MLLLTIIAVIYGTVILIQHHRDLGMFINREVHPAQTSDEIKLIPQPKTAAEKIVNGAKREALRGVQYDASYVRIPYPGGDVPADRGACTDVIIRALRSGGLDLQKLIHEDMSAHFDLYPHKWGLRSPDPNIDHRRVPNHIAFLERFGKKLPVETTGEAAKTWEAGDLVYWDLGSGQTHCGIISNDRGAEGLPLVIHNIGPTVRQEDCLTSWKIIGHFRYPIHS